MLLILGIGLVFLGCGVFLAHRMSKSEDGQMFEMRNRLIISVVIFTLIGASATSGFFVLIVVIPAGVILSFMWLPPLVDTVLSGLTGAMTGGNLEIES